MLRRRAFLGVCSRFRLTPTFLPGVLWAMADEKSKVTRQMIEDAAVIADVRISDEYKDMMLASLNDLPQSFEAIYGLRIKNDVAPALIFDPVVAGMKFETLLRRMKISSVAAAPGSRPPKNP